MSDFKSLTPLEAVDKYFDMLIKSRFIEMFGNLDINDKHWKMSTIGESAKVPLHYGSTASAIDYDSETRYVRITDIDSDGRLNDDFKSPNSYNSNYLLNKGDILFARSGSVGTTYLFDEDYRSIFAGYLIRFIPDREKLDPEFAYQFTRSAYCQGILVGSKRGGVQKNVNAKQLSAIPVPLPPMSLQKEFVDFVHQVDKSKAICKKIFESFDNLVKSRFIEMFGSIKENEKGIEKTILKTVCDQIVDGSHNPSKGGEQTNYLMLSSKNIVDGAITYDCPRFLSKEDFYLENKRTQVKAGDILMTIVGTIGRTAIVPESAGSITFQRSVAVLHLNNQLVDQVFLKYCLDSIQSYIESKAHGTSQKGIYLNQVEKIPILIPELNLQKEFAFFVHQINKSKFYSIIKRPVRINLFNSVIFAIWVINLAPFLSHYRQL